MRFLLIDRFTAWEPGVRAAATKNVALSEDFFDDHFPRRPVMPGVLMIEGLAQLAGLLLEASLKQQFAQDAKAILSVVERTKFREMIRPGDQPERVRPASPGCSCLHAVFMAQPRNGRISWERMTLARCVSFSSTGLRVGRWAWRPRRSRTWR